MSNKKELLDILNAAELKELLGLTTIANARDLVEHDLLRRQGEIELELSSATAARDEAVAKSRAATDRIRRQLKTGQHTARLVASLSVFGLALLAALAGVILRWPAGMSLLTTWRTPFEAGWITAFIWTVLFGAFAVTVVEADFYLRRLPARRIRINREEKLDELRAAVDSAQTARQNDLVALVRNHVTEILNSSQGPTFGSLLVVGSDGSIGHRKHVTVGVGLSEVTNDDNRVPTDVQQRLVQLITKLPGASIGISGPRGVGKSTLLAAMCGANPTIDGRPAIAICTSAPIEYDGREFLLHLFSSLCRQVLRTEGQEKSIREDWSASMAAVSWQRTSIMAILQPIGWLLTFAGMLLVLIAVVSAVLLQPPADQLLAPSQTKVPVAIETSAATLSPPPSNGHAPAPPAQQPSSATTPLISGNSQTATLNNKIPTLTPSSTSPVTTAVPNPALEVFEALSSSPLGTLGVVSLIFGFTAILFTSLRAISRSDSLRREDDGSERSTLVTRAAEELSNIYFQRSYTSGWSGTLKIPVGLDIASSAGLTLAQYPESLPELVERFRIFVREVTKAYDNIVLIGIDELDKLKSVQQAEAFLNGVKSVFNIPRCFYLISVSEHALAAFERRGMAFRDAFDSALDDIVHVCFLNLKQSRLLLNRRILRLPDPFLQLCYMLSGGLPRDLIRNARALLDCALQSPSGSLTLTKAVEQMAAHDLAARLRATSIAMRTVKEMSETSNLLVKVASLPSNADIENATSATQRFCAHIKELSQLRESEEGRVLLRIADELAIYYEIMILSRRVAALLCTREGWQRANELELADHVARVRQALEVGVPIAEVRLGELRKAVDDAAVELESEVKRHLYPQEPAEFSQTQ